MHKTLHPKVKGNIDVQNKNGWAFHVEQGVLPLTITPTDTLYSIKQRPDVCKFFNNQKLLLCGWEFSEPVDKYAVIEMLIDGEWHQIFRFNSQLDPSLNVSLNVNIIPSFVVGDNIYKDPDSVRRFALTQTFNEDPAYHKGKRSNKTFLFPGLKETFEALVGRKIVKWNDYGINGIFQYCVAGEQLVYHCDTQQYAGVLFLTPDAPPQSGTTFFRSKATKKMKVAEEDYKVTYPHGHLDSTDFDVVDVVGNIYNRVVLFDSKMIHAASGYFGNNIENGRLFQLFFFELE